MAGPTDSLSDKALSIFAFAAYHSLISGERVASVIRRDGHGHEADPEGVAEITDKGLATCTDEQIAFTAEGEAFVGTVIASLRAARGR
ncbi:hypothetical protein [Methylobacterium sp. J-068]|uniref:hypothetical protein n=1 Tax=Methylobacterium sp. J-068 TaxID=2836649 RepID=UPI001FB8B4DB|nr:hypothetical protein [Methylobacterium sp. J-068]MCJ2034008.1 hypothetical protein [Methylobacterium sp. J-068]